MALCAPHSPALGVPHEPPHASASGTAEAAAAGRGNTTGSTSSSGAPQPVSRPAEPLSVPASAASHATPKKKSSTISFGRAAVGIALQPDHHHGLDGYPPSRSGAELQLYTPLVPTTIDTEAPLGPPLPDAVLYVRRDVVLKELHRIDAELHSRRRSRGEVTDAPELGDAEAAVGERRRNPLQSKLELLADGLVPDTHDGPAGVPSQRRQHHHRRGDAQSANGPRERHDDHDRHRHDHQERQDSRRGGIAADDGLDSSLLVRMLRAQAEELELSEAGGEDDDDEEEEEVLHHQRHSPSRRRHTPRSSTNSMIESASYRVHDNEEQLARHGGRHQNQRGASATSSRRASSPSPHDPHHYARHQEPSNTNIMSNADHRLGAMEKKSNASSPAVTGSRRKEVAMAAATAVVSTGRFLMPPSNGNAALIPPATNVVLRSRIPSSSAGSASGHRGSTRTSPSASSSRTSSAAAVNVSSQPDLAQMKGSATTTTEDLVHTPRHTANRARQSEGATASATAADVDRRHEEILRRLETLRTQREEGYSSRMRKARNQY